MGNNQFISNANNITRTENQAIAYKSSKSSILDYFVDGALSIGSSESEIQRNLKKIFKEDIGLAIKVILYHRLITRKEKYTDSKAKGQGRKDQYIRCLKWIDENANKYKEVDLRTLFVHMTPIVGSWKDLWYDSPVTGMYHYFAPKVVYKTIIEYMKDEDIETLNLIVKYLPKFRSKSNIKNPAHARKNKWIRDFIKQIRKDFDPTFSLEKYRLLKKKYRDGHNFQVVMSTRDWKNFDFNEVPGQALFKMASSKKFDSFLQRHNLESNYINYITNNNIKFTGHVHQLYREVVNLTRINYYGSLETLSKIDKARLKMIDKQFQTLIDQSELDKNVWVVLDRSGSMIFPIEKNLTALDLASALTIYFSSIIKGEFKNSFVEFGEKSSTYKFKNKKSFHKKVIEISGLTPMGSTNFQSVIDLIISIKKSNPDIPDEDYPDVILAISDMQFNPTGYRTNHDQSVKRLKKHNIKVPEFVWWDVRKTSNKPATKDTHGATLISGYDGAILENILKGETTIVDKETGKERKLNPYENMLKALDQDVLNIVNNYLPV